VSDFLRALRSGKVLLMDGAMGTELQRLHNSNGVDLALQVHSAYTAAGAEVVLTNTFQANPSAHEQWQHAIQTARRARPRARFVLADIGPIDKLTRALAAAALASCWTADGILLETWSSLPALRTLARARTRSSPPLLVSFTFLHAAHDELMTFAGATPEACARAAQRCGAAAIGANCGKEIDMDDMLEIVQRYREACDLPIFVRPNAGTPKPSRTGHSPLPPGEGLGVRAVGRQPRRFLPNPQPLSWGERGAGWRYPRTPKAMAAWLPALLGAGVRMIGGCCGTTPDHIRAFRAVVDAWNDKGPDKAQAQNLK
jgi:methionine synthase I (cobalamin-dependent)